MQMQIIIERFIRSEKSHSYDLHPFDLIVLTMLASYMGKNTRCWPSYKTLEKDCRLSKRTLIRVIQRLEDLKILTVFRSNNKNNIYGFYPQVVSESHQVVSHSHHVVSDSHPNNIINNINNNYKEKSKIQRPKPKEFSGVARSAETPSKLLLEFMNKK